MSRTVHYRFEGAFLESAAEKVLAKAKARGIVTEYDTGRGRLVWFEGAPGDALRKVRREITRIVRLGT